MTFENDLRHTLRLFANGSDEPSGLAFRKVVEAGEKKRRRAMRFKHLGTAFAGVSVPLAATLALTAGAPATASQFEIAPAPADVNEHILDLVKAELPSGVHPTTAELEAFGDHPVGVWTESPMGIPLEATDWSRATAWRTTLHLNNGHTIVVSIQHAAGEVEGARSATCVSDLGAGVLDECHTGTRDVQGTAVEIMWASKSDIDIAPAPGAPARDLDLASTWLESSPGGDFALSVTEQMPTPDVGSVAEHASLGPEAMADIVLDPTLLTVG